MASNRIVWSYCQFLRVARANQEVFLLVDLWSIPSANYTSDDISKLSEAAPLSPSFLWAHGQLMYQSVPGAGADAVSSFAGLHADCGESGFDGIGDSDVLQVSGRKVIEDEQHAVVLGGALDRPRVRVPAIGDELKREFSLSVIAPGADRLCSS